MGNKPATKQSDQLAEVLKTCQLVPQQASDDCIKRPYKLYLDPGRSYLELWEFTFDVESEFSQKEELIENLKRISSFYHLQIHEVKKQLQEEFCSTIYHMSVLAEHPISTLEEFILNRGQKTPFNESELAHLLGCVAQAQAELPKNFYLNFNNIHYATNDLWKLRCFERNQSFIQAYNANLKNEPNQLLYHIYPSPEELAEIKSFNQEKSTVFTLGMLLLHLAQASDCDNLYQQKKIDEAGLAKRLKELKYSENLSQLIREMLELEPTKRIDYNQIRQRLKFPSNKQTPGFPSGPSNFSSQPNRQSSGKFQSFGEDPHFQPHEVSNSGRGIRPTISQLSNPSIPATPQPGQAKNSGFLNPYAAIPLNQNLPSQLSFTNNQALTQQGGLINKLPSAISYILASNNDPNQEGYIYHGPKVNDKAEGQGQLYFPNKELKYEGMFHEGKFSDFGKLYNQSPTQLTSSLNYKDLTQIEPYWKFYEGDFKDNKRDGVGVLQFTNGERYIGGFQNDQITGHGTFYELSGAVRYGYWENGKFIEKF